MVHDCYTVGTRLLHDCFSGLFFLPHAQITQGDREHRHAQKARRGGLALFSCLRNQNLVWGSEPAQRKQSTSSSSTTPRPYGNNQLRQIGDRVLDPPPCGVVINPSSSPGRLIGYRVKPRVGELEGEGKGREGKPCRFERRSWRFLRLPCRVARGCDVPVGGLLFPRSWPLAVQACVSQQRTISSYTLHSITYVVI